MIGDFFTYADRSEDYWSGYYTSRPTHKAFSRIVEAELRSAEILFSLARHWQPNLASELNSETCRSLYDKISSARRSLALFQHHDAITGTARRHVMTDYRRGSLKLYTLGSLRLWTIRAMSPELPSPCFSEPDSRMSKMLFTIKFYIGAVSCFIPQAGIGPFQGPLPAQSSSLRAWSKCG
ncbi:unnamed protein product [Dibothriocephalus latus]|uniref:mannosyl-oligosaccharide 1,3-1,6-alpha-mannosidase n=1 Tax=Dibothriocephalus latus TaxID=60516 RepID=A0A3P7QFJ7_DIBLA|nr:unnamed protein product [Dibothriocephalus latus]